ncbi:MAG: hypothetical protein E6Q98_19960 [Rhodospirillaceae bacterium]|nr:MAG: hypothetical protein E6Q98_19960 [Rhodospirillaceae bacterium]
MITTSYLRRDYLESTGDKDVAKPSINGVPYYLPKTVLPITVEGKFVPKRKLDDKEIDKKELYDYTMSITVGNPTQVADPTGLYLLEYHTEGIANDHFELKTNEKGLIQTVDAKSDDKSGAIILKVGELIAQVLPVFLAKKTAKPQQEVEDEEKAAKLACNKALKPFKLDTQLSLTDQLRRSPTLHENANDPLGQKEKDIQAFLLEDAELRALDYKIRHMMYDGEWLHDDEYLANARRVVEVYLEPNIPSAQVGDDQLAYEAKVNKGARGILFRVSEPRTAEIRFNVSQLNVTLGSPTGSKADRVLCRLAGGNSRATNITYAVANPNYTIAVDMSRSVLVEKKVNLAVADGVLQSIIVDKPSTVLAAASIPIDIAKAFASIPSAALQFKIENINAEKGVTEAQAAKLKAEIELIKAKEDLEAAKKGANAASGE